MSVAEQRYKAARRSWLRVRRWPRWREIGESVGKPSTAGSPSTKATAFSARLEQPSPVVQGSGQPGQTVPQATPVLRRPTLPSPSRCSP